MKSFEKLSCCATDGHTSSSEAYVTKKVALVGQPNVGKSCVFNHITGSYTVVSNYAGTTLELKRAVAQLEGEKIEVADLPGIYSLSEQSENALVTLEYIQREKVDAIINVVDATALARNLYLTLQLIELGLPVVVAINFTEEAKRKGIEVKPRCLERKLGVPVVMINALSGKGIYKATKLALETPRPKRQLRYSKEIELIIQELQQYVQPSILSERYIVARLLEGDVRYGSLIKIPDKVRRRIKTVGAKIATQLSIELHGKASVIAEQCSELSHGMRSMNIGERLDELLVHNLLLGALLSIGVLFLGFIGLLALGGLLEEFIITSFEDHIIPYLLALLPQHVWIQALLKYALLGIEAGLAIALPYILLFFLFLSFLEDTGILARIVFISDKWMHKLGLHGQSVVPMLLGFGCNVPAITATRMLTSTRERTLTCTIISLIPCSARTAVIMGAAAFFLGWQYAMLIYLVIFALIVFVGKLLAWLLPGHSTGLIMELPAYRKPSPRNILLKTWVRLKEFVYVAFPLLIVGSVLLGLLYSAGLLKLLIAPFLPITAGLLMLPEPAAISLVFGILRKEMALETLAVLGGTVRLPEFMSSLQIFTFTLVTALYLPCLATFAVLMRELGLKRALFVAAGTITLAITIGAIVARVLLLLGLFG
jgi:ferrous iron transport protein B